jgi:hypothetical protein
MTNTEGAIINIIWPKCGINIKKAHMDRDRLCNTKILKCLSCKVKMINPYYISSFNKLFFRTKIDNINATLNLLALQEKNREDELRRGILAKEQEERLKLKEEENRILAYQEMLNESYFLEEENGEKPYSLEQVKQLMSNGKIRLSTKIKYGYDSTVYKPVFSFEELNQNYKDFI